MKTSWGARTLVFVAMLGIGGSVTTTAQASTWHKGTPKVVRGSFQTKKYGADLTMSCVIRPKAFIFSASGMPTQVGYNVHYKNLGHHHYIIRYDAKPAGLFKGGKKLTMRVNQAGKNVRVNGYKILFHRQ